MAVCAASAAQADESPVALVDYNGTKTYNEDTTFSHVGVGYSGGTGTVTVNGVATINSTLPYVLSNGNKRFQCQIQNGSTFEADSIVFNGIKSDTYPCGFNIQGTVKTDSLTVSNSADKGTTITITNTGKIVSSSGTPGILTIGENTTMTVLGSHNEYSNGTSATYIPVVELDINVNGGTLDVREYVELADITLNSGTASIDKNSTVGDITLNAGTLTLKDGAAVSGITMGSSVVALTDGVTTDTSVLNISGDVKTGALTLNSGTVNFEEGASIDLGGEDLFLSSLVDVNLSVDSFDNIEDVALFTNAKSADGLDNLSVTFTDAEGVTKAATLSYGSDGSVVANIPEPNAFGLLAGLGAIALAVSRRRVKKA
ncbi:MAG: PEP-CTERM sorting domain-containing protein [Verrucomicrobia bacterium]|nr:PEP-CTERM sorting domain-containing protein [Verrucomicrobiota bacterium]